MNRFTYSHFGVLLVAFIAAAALAHPSQNDWDDLGPNVMVQDSLRPIIENFDAYHRSQN